MAHEFGLRLSLIAFAAAMSQGLLRQNEFQPTLKMALAAVGVCYLLGCLCGELARRCIEESVRSGLEAPRSPVSAP